jgi:hypothetical protein
VKHGQGIIFDFEGNYRRDNRPVKQLMRGVWDSKPGDEYGLAAAGELHLTPALAVCAAAAATLVMRRAHHLAPTHWAHTHTGCGLPW